jgi:DNA-directed RNA polymerase subunit RPC12/RpoP
LTFPEIISLAGDTRILIGIGAVIFLIMVLPAFFNWRKTVRCPRCRKWFRLEYQGFEVRDKVVGQSNTRYGGGLGNRFFARLFLQASRTNADPFIREWGTASFLCKNCGCRILIDTKRDR